MKGMLYLTGAILTEVFGSTMLKLSQGFSQLLPSIGVLIGFGCALVWHLKRLTFRLLMQHGLALEQHSLLLSDSCCLTKPFT